MKKFNILVFTSGRSDFDLLLPLIKKLEINQLINLTLIVTGSHLSVRHGLTINNIKNKNIKDIKKIDIKCSNVTEKNISLIYGNAQNLYGKYFSNLKKKIHLSVILGDRYEALAFAVACFFSNTPIAHIHGGEITSGSKDDTIRHAITKLSNLHFVSNKEHKKRVIQLGEKTSTIFNCGLLGYESLCKIILMSKEQVGKVLKINFDQKTILVSYHSVTTISKKENISQFNQILDALKIYKKFNIIFTSPNIDPGNTDILSMIKKFIIKNKNSYFFKSLGQKLFFSVAKNSNIFIGNSSSGILEIPFLNVPVLNIGNRQKGRFKFVKIFNSSAKKEIIIKNINNILLKKNKNKNFKPLLIKNASSIIEKKIVEKLKDKKYSYLTHKIFNDLNF
tara:strand:- start:2933 stop:4108 length:1176 start_codon:yes stop_codon:yes gene_type:complete